MSRSLVFVAWLVLGMVAPASAQVRALPEGAARDLPSTVLSAFEKSYPAASITDASQDRQDGKIVFRVDALDKGRRRVLVYDLAGGLVEGAEQVDEADLPPPVADAIRAQARVQYVKGMKVTRGAAVRYELTLRGTRKTTMIVKADGTVVSFK